MLASQVLAELRRQKTQNTESQPRRRVICIDGPSGAGKTTLALAVAEKAAARGQSATVLHLDHLLDGWDGLSAAPAVLERQVLRHLSDERVVQHRRYDWARGHFVTPVEIPVTDLLLVEGVGAGANVISPYCDLLVWVEGDPELSRQRALARDGDTFAPWIDAWTHDQRAHHTREETRRRSDLHLDT